MRRRGAPAQPRASRQSGVESSPEPQNARENARCRRWPYDEEQHERAQVEPPSPADQFRGQRTSGSRPSASLTVLSRYRRPSCRLRGSGCRRRRRPGSLSEMLSAILGGQRARRSAPRFSSSRSMRLVPGIGITSGPCANSQARQSCADGAALVGGDRLDALDQRAVLG